MIEFASLRSELWLWLWLWLFFGDLSADLLGKFRCSKGFFINGQVAGQLSSYIWSIWDKSFGFITIVTVACCDSTAPMTAR